MVLKEWTIGNMENSSKQTTGKPQVELLVDHGTGSLPNDFPAMVVW